MLSILTLIGGGLGGLMRFVPELLNYFKRKQENAHELSMMDKQLAVDQARADQAIDLDHTEGKMNAIAGEMAALGEAIKSQGKITGIGWVDAMSQTVRPILTYWWMVLFTVHKVCSIVLAFMIYKVTTLEGFAGFTKELWRTEDGAILSMIIGFWFVDRCIKYFK